SKIATTFINGLQLVKSLSGKSNSGFSSDKSYEELMNTVLGVSALVTGSQQAVTTRRSALEQAGQSIGQAQDIKGSIDQNTQLQVQAGLTINELIGVMNGAVGSLQADNQRRLTDISNSKKALTYGGN
ncbi:conjugal transfer protein, partial [Mesorhizobium sp. M8A.F.Ca.ET.023.01.1.1]